MGDTDPDAWSGTRVERWLKLADGLERQLAPVAELLARTAALHRLDLRLGGGLDAEQAARGALDLGPSRAATADLDDGQRLEAGDAVAQALRTHVQDGEVVLGGEVLVVSAYR